MPAIGFRIARESAFACLLVFTNLTAGIEGSHVSFGDGRIRGESVLSLCSFILEQFVQLSAGAFDLGALDGFAPCQRTGHHVGVRQQSDGDFQSFQRLHRLSNFVCDGGTVRQLSWCRRSDKGDAVRVVVALEQIGP